MIPLIQREVIDYRKWIPASEFLDLLTLAQSVPGPIAINTAVFVGYKRSGLRGACASLLGDVLPSFLIILAIALFFAGIRQNPVVDAAFKGMRPAVVALIIAPLVTLTRGMHWSMIVLAAALAGLIWWLGLSPVLILAAGAGAGIVWELSIAKRVSNDILGTVRQLSENRILRLRRRLCHAVADPERSGRPARLDDQRRIRRHRGRIADHARPHRHHSATYVGYTVGMQSGSVWYGILGSVIATFAVCLPSMTLMILVARYIARLNGNPLVSGAMRGLRPVVIGMIGAAALLLMFPQDAGDASFIDFWSWILFGGVLAGSYFKLNPILLIVLSAAAGIAIYL